MAQLRAIVEDGGATFVFDENERVTIETGESGTVLSGEEFDDLVHRREMWLLERRQAAGRSGMGSRISVVG